MLARDIAYLPQDIHCPHYMTLGELIELAGYAEKDRSQAAIRARLDKIMPGWDKFLRSAREGRILYLDSGEVATPTLASAEHTLDAFAARKE
ncbi:hypothetical protein ACN6KF_006354 [Labrys sp. La1]|uniref:hypothetical protein n=1 Tax=Labrys sp. La1 TaxID=3404917 RepID=UPI003EC0208B